MFKIPLKNVTICAFPDHGMRFGSIRAYYIILDESSMEKQENEEKDLVNDVVAVESETKDDNFDRIIRHVGPIWGQYEAEKKVKAFMAKNKMSDWTWTGGWYSENLTSYAEFQRRSKN